MRVGHSAKSRERWHDIYQGWLVDWLVGWLVDRAISVHRDERYIGITRVRLYTANRSGIGLGLKVEFRLQPRDRGVVNA